MVASTKPKPTALHLVDGTYKKLAAADKRRRAQEPRAEVGVGAPPPEFNADQLAVWQRVVADAPPGLLTRTDHDVVVGYAALVSARLVALKLYNASGAQPLIRDRDGSRLVLNPFLRELKRLSEQLRLLQAELGFTPSARVRVSVANPDEGDDLDAFL